MPSTDREISCRITRTLLLYVKEQNSGSLGPLLEGLDLDEQYLLDTNNWVSHAFLHVLYRRMIFILHDENSVYKFALASGRLGSLGLLDGLVRLVGSPRLLYSQAPKYNRLLKLNGDVYVHKLTSSSVLIEDRYHDSTRKTRYDCDYTRGILVGIPTMFDLPPARVEEIECQVAPGSYGTRVWPDSPSQGAAGCLYKVEWTAKKGRFLSRNAVIKATEDLQEANTRLQDKYEEARKLASDLETVNRWLRESQRQVESNTAELRASEERYRFLADNVSDIIWTLSLDTMRFTYISPSAEKIFGFSPEEFMRRGPEEILSADSAEAVTSVLREELSRDGEAGQEPNRHRTFELRQRCRDGSYKWVEATTSFIRNGEGQPIGVLGVTRDISERKRAEEMLRESETRMNRAQEIAHLGSWEMDLVNNRLSWSDEVYRIFGLRPEEFAGTYDAFLEAVHPDDRLAVKEAYSASLREGKNAYEIEHRVVRKSTGVVRIVHEKCEHIRDGSGRVIRSVGMVHDITESRRAEEALRESEHKLRLFIEHAPAAVAMFDREMRYIAVSRRWLADYGPADGDVIGRSHYEVFPEIPERWKEIHRRCLAGATEKAEEDRFVRLDGRIDWISWEILPWYENAEVGGIIILAETVTKRKQAENALKKARDELEERVRERTGELREAYEKLREETAQLEQAEARLRQAQKMEAIGTLAGGIAHDFNNMLAIIIGNVELALDELRGEGTIRNNLTQIFKASKRGRDLVKQILTFSRKSDLMRKPLEMAPLVKETFDLLRSSIPANIEMTLDIRAGDVAVSASPSEIQQIIMNLASNAEYAMRGSGGTLAFHFGEKTYFPGERLPEADMEPGDYLVLTVSDTGAGMTTETRKRIFDPFFTTKEIGEGTGMGLAVVYGIVRDLGGGIEVSSKPGRGTTFRIFLPKTLPEGQEQREDVESPRGGEERILFVDDEEAVAETNRRTLERLGYRVTAMTDGEKALELFLADPMKYDIVITDQAMPRITGTKLAEKMLAVREDVPIVLCTGYSHLVSSGKAKAIGIRDFLMKPIARKELGETIRRVLDDKLRTTPT